jgi:hypothetical protein
VEEISDEDMAALRSAFSWGGRVAAAHTVTREILESQARLHAIQAAKIKAPVPAADWRGQHGPARPEVNAVAAALPDAQILVLAGQPHIADILDPETYAKHLVGFLQGSPRPDRVGHG